jgi:hypothetical protein
MTLLGLRGQGWEPALLEPCRRSRPELRAGGGRKGRENAQQGLLLLTPAEHQRLGSQAKLLLKTEGLWFPQIGQKKPSAPVGQGHSSI